MVAKCSRPSAFARIGETIDAGRLKLVRVLGEGAYGVVYLAVDQHGGAASSSSSSTPIPREYAVKVLRKAPIYTTEGQCQSREIVTHKIATGHTGVLTLYDVFEDEKHIYLVLDYCPGGDLYTAIVEERIFARNNVLIKDVFLQLLDAVQSLHDKGIYHRDLKPDNIFVGADGKTIHLGDFGLATDQAVTTSFSCGSSYYMSPECIGEEHNYQSFSTPASDVWSLGVILTNMISGRNPWRYATTSDENFNRFMNDPDALRETLPISLAACDLLKRVFTFRSGERISLPELRAAVLAVDDFFLTDGQLATSSPAVKCAAAGYTPRIPAPETPEFSGKAAFSSMHDFPDDEYLYASPSSESPVSSTSSSTSSSASSSTGTTASCVSSALSSTSTFFEDASVGAMEKVVSDDLIDTKRPFGATMRMLERLML